MKTYIFTYCLSLLLATGLTPLVIVWARKRNLVDKPDVRKIHTKSIARVGGIAIFLSAILAIIPLSLLPNRVGEQFRASGLQISALILGACMMFGLGLYDDLKRVRIRTKLVVQFLAAILVCAAGIYIQSITIRGFGTLSLSGFGCVITIIWIIGITNAVNLMDGLDGLTAGIVAIGCGFLAIVSVWGGNVILAALMLALLGSLQGFLFYNFYPARIFMGDCGSLFLGFLIAGASILTAAKSAALVGIGMPLLILGIPIFDTLFAMLRRFLERRGILSPDKGHFHHRLLALGLGQHQIAIIAYVITAAISGFGLLLMITNGTASVLVLTAGMILFVLIFRLIGSVELRKTLEGIRKRAGLTKRQRIEQHHFEESQLYFQNAKTFDQWWQCMCKAAKALEFARLSLELSDQESNGKPCRWQNGTELDEAENILQMKIPIQDNLKKQTHYFQIEILTNGSLESASRRAALFSRLADENKLDALMAKIEKQAVDGSR